jgi:DNA-binding response OmpR family regulator
VSFSSFPKEFREDLIEWQLSYVSVDFSPEDLLGFPDSPCVLLVEARDTAVIERIQLMEKRMHSFIRQNSEILVVLSPIIMVFQSPALLINTSEFPDFVSDWMFSPVLVSDLARRIFASLKRRNVLKTRLHFGPLTLIRDSRSITYEDRIARLTPSEFILAELFLSQMGVVISFKDLAQFFRSSGKSAEANNIRVMIYQVRLKLEMLTKSQFMLTSIYKQGYCMRHKIVSASSAQGKRSH